MAIHAYQDDDTAKEDEKSAKAKRARKDFDCPSCSANNPIEDALRDKDEVLCNYCGNEYLVSVSDEGALKFRER